MSRGCPSPRRPPSELGGEVPALTSCLPPRSRLLHLYAAVFFGSSSSINISRFRFLLSLSVFEAPAFGRHLCTGVVSVCFGSVWQWGIHFWVSGKMTFIRQFCYGRKNYLKNTRLLALVSEIYCLIR